MSGIGGIFNLDGSDAALDDLCGMKDAMEHRGPDRGAVWREGCIGLVHLDLQDLPLPAQPFHRGRISLVMDGRIDNARALGRVAHAPREASVLDSIAEGYSRLGERIFPWILGDFALALWDADQEQLVLARDPMALKPLFYFLDDTRLVFSSEAKGILAVSDVPCEPDSVRFEELKDCRFREMNRTFFRGIRRLGPGDFLRVGKGSLRQGTFWQMDPGRHIRMRDRDAYRRRFRKIFFDAVRCRLPKTGTAAVRLSGGLDSSSIAGTAARIRDAERSDVTITPISILSERFPDEHRYIDSVCSMHRFSGKSFVAEKEDPLKDIDAAIFHQEAPLFDIIDTWLVRQHELAAKCGAKVVLGGEWGDQVMNNGCVYLVDLLTQGRLLDFWRELRLFQKTEGGTLKEILKPILWYLVLPARITDRYAGLRYLIKRWTFIGDSVEVSGPAFRTANQRSYYDHVLGIGNTLMVESLGQIGAQAGVDIRLPFRDRRIMSFIAAIPVEENIREGWGRRLEREALADLLPQSIAQRRDKGDYTDLEQFCFRQAGFDAKDEEEAFDTWRSNVRRIWEDIWIRKNAPASGENTSRLALSNTATSGR